MADVDDDRWLRAVRIALVEALNQLGGEWRDDGRLVVGRGTVAVLAEDVHRSGTGHVDLGFVLDRNDPGVPIIWDCVAGGPGPVEEAAEIAVSIWARTTAPTILELLGGGRGELADHAHGDDGLGLAGWHSIHGPILGYGVGDAAELQRWSLEHAVVPALREPLARALTGAVLHGVKFLFGGSTSESIAEVRVDGQRDEACSAALLALPWPRSAEAAFVRHFVLFIHPAD
jgi:hypothetical protein